MGYEIWKHSVYLFEGLLYINVSHTTAQRCLFKSLDHKRIKSISFHSLLIYRLVASRHSASGSFSLHCNQLLFQPSFDPLLSFVRHTSSPLFSAIIAWERSPLWYCLHAKSLSRKTCGEVPCALSAGGEKKSSYTCGRQTRFSEIWHIYHPGTGYELFCHLKGEGGFA